MEKGKGPTVAVAGTDIQPCMGRGTAGVLPWCPLDSTKKFAASYTIVNASTVPVRQKLPNGDASGNYKHPMPVGG
ncbi:MAG: hypothetical protein ACREDQ_09795 [Limisphaerales bacterium]